MLKVGMDVAPEPFAFAPLLLIVLAAVVALVVLFLLVRFRKENP